MQQTLYPATRGIRSSQHRTDRCNGKFRPSQVIDSLKTQRRPRGKVQYAVLPGSRNSLYGKIGMSSFTDEQVMRPEAQELIPKIEMKRTPGFEGQTSWTEPFNVVEIHMKDGSILKAQAERDSVGALRGASYEEVRTKYLDTAAVSMTQKNSSASLEMLGNLGKYRPGQPTSRSIRWLRATAQ
ncbi:MAG: hypothetical protein CM1200mP22_34310 [Dehalococcoidia bacterium]|nr:MAG: hypothetical protein CM1200mP22_34310 [Dehalococcoidia bacterium]